MFLRGRNIMVPDFETAIYRIDDYINALNAMRLDGTPLKTPVCTDRNGFDGICTRMRSTDMSFPQLFHRYPDR
jgi:hypothetical protein